MSLKRNNILLIIGGILIGAGIGVVFLFAILGGDDFSIGSNAEVRYQPAVPEIDAPAPRFALDSLSGEEIDTGQLIGKPLMINFWATWCGPCRLEMPLLQEYSLAHEDSLEVLAVNVGESSEEVQVFVDEMGLDLPVLLDQTNSVENLYRVRGLPSTFFIDRDGIIRYEHIGLLSEGQLRGYLEGLGVIE